MNRINTKIILGSLVISLVLVMSACNQTPEQNERPVPQELPEDTESLVLLAKFDLTIKIGVDLEKISTESIEKTNFADASLGVPEPGVEYPAVVTPGIIIILKADGETYEYHASGERVVQVP
ncbi:MAG: hypothetical protein WBB69_16190 [Anaerolineales bacterium]